MNTFFVNITLELPKQLDATLLALRLLSAYTQEPKIAQLRNSSEVKQIISELFRYIIDTGVEISGL